MKLPMKRAVFLDRDGVLNEALVRDGRPYPPASIEELQIVPGAASALARLKQAGFALIVVSNQPDVARGAQTRDAVEAMNNLLRAALPIDDFILCFHDESDGCGCRKPKPGLILEGAAKYGIDLAKSFMIGDRWRDMDAGAAAGCTTLLIDYGYRERPPQNQPSYRVGSLGAAVDRILEEPWAAHEPGSAR